MFNDPLIKNLLVFALAWLASLGLIHLARYRQGLARAALTRGRAFGLAFLPATWALLLANRVTDTTFFSWCLACGALLFLMAYDDWVFRSVATGDLVLYAGLVLAQYILFGRPLFLSRLLIALVMGGISLVILRLYPQGFGQGDAWVIGLSAFLCGTGFYPQVFLLGLGLALIQAIGHSLWLGALSRYPIPLVTWLNAGLALSLLLWPTDLDQWI